MNASSSRISKPNLPAVRSTRPGEEIPQQQTTARSAAKAPASSFDARPAAARTSGEKHVPLPSLSLAREAPAAGPIALDSAKGRQMVQRAQEVLGRGQRQGIAPGEGSAFAARSVERDELGMTHVRMDRSENGLPVFGQQVIVHFGKDGKPADTTGDTAPLPMAQGALEAAKVSPYQALETARAAFGKEFGGISPEQSSTPRELLYKAPDGQYHRAFQVQLTNVKDGDVPVKMNYFVDAQSGQVLRQFNQLGGFVDRSQGAGAGGASGAGVAPERQGAAASAAAAGQAALGKGHSMYSGTVQIGTTKNADGSFTLKDQKRGGGATWDARNQDPASGKKAFKDANNVWGEKGDSKREKAAIDAHYGMERTWDFYKGILGRDSIDGKGEALNSYVHVGSKYVNAYWDGEKMNYGDGDGVDASALTALDVAGHEITHGLTERTAGLIYDGESGGLNEAMSDILGGVGVEWYAAKRNPNVKWDYLIGEDVWTPGKKGDALRYMNDPKKDGYSIDNYRDYPKQTEVHGSSGIANNAFYLLSHGGKNRTSGIEVKDAIGPEKSLKIFARALTTYMTPSTTFKEARQACLKAAADLYGAGSPEALKVAEAWKAVGVK
ncbi:MAG TPA: M4 family metallopeptidase [Myxococcaceae bacterium]|jgi:Zn-dependent metalloprotease